MRIAGLLLPVSHVIVACAVAWSTPSVARVSSIPSDHEKKGTIAFAVIGVVQVMPLKQSSGNDQRCSVRITSRGNTPQTIMTMPTLAEAAPDMVPTVCLSIRAFGRVPSPPGTYRIGLIYSGFTGYVLRPDNSYIVPVILTRTNRNPKWVIDEALGSKLADAVIETVPAMRLWLERRKF